MAYEKFVEGQKDFSSIILKFKEAGAEGIIVLISPSDGITFVKQMKEAGLGAEVPVRLQGLLAGGVHEGPRSPIRTTSATTVSGPRPCRTPAPKSWAQAFQDSHDGDTSVSVGLSYAGAQILFTAIERAGVLEPGKVRDEVFGGTLPRHHDGGHHL